MCGCTKSVEKSIRSLDGVEAVNVNLASETATIIFDESRIRLERIAEEVRKSGYELELPDSTEILCYRYLVCIVPSVWAALKNLSYLSGG